MVGSFELGPGEKPGEKKFLETFEKVHKEKPSLYEKEPKERIKHTIEEIKAKIADLPEVKREERFHTSGQVEATTNIVSQGIQIALEKGVDEALKFIYKTENPYIIDAFHDILIGHFLEIIFKNK